MPQTINPRPGQRLHEVREHRAMSQGKLAKAIGVSVGAIQNYEHGRARITIERLEQLAQALQCEPADLIIPPGSRLPLYRHWRTGNPWRRSPERDRSFQAMPPATAED